MITLQFRSRYRAVFFLSITLQLPSSPSSWRVSCGLRNERRKTLWRGRVLSTEAIQAVHVLKLAKNSPSRLEIVFNSNLARLLKADLLDAFSELQRQNELDLSLKVFDFLRREPWYVPDVSLFNNMILIAGKHKKIDMVEKLFSELTNEGLEPNARTYTELIGAYFTVEMVEKAMETYELMKASGLTPEELTLTLLIRSLEKAGEANLLETIMKECDDYFDYPHKFLEQVRRKYVSIIEFPPSFGAILEDGAFVAGGRARLKVG
ncbi:hypothetical protein M569_07101 [Genlisea aurea]|uniref:PROP1-like PPR domain-containing protein n=1 Tax=Genlisea aurea TaxID=192259 RepID=S8E5N0_9LAMI|nr:hypothetical protein M569_07101 [Genlisea aurea]